MESKYQKLGYLNNGIFKDPKEPFESWFNRKIESMVGGTDEQVANLKEGVQNPKPLTSFKTKN